LLPRPKGCSGPDMSWMLPMTISLPWARARDDRLARGAASRLEARVPLKARRFRVMKRLLVVVERPGRAERGAKVCQGADAVGITGARAPVSAQFVPGR